MFNRRITKRILQGIPLLLVFTALLTPSALPAQSRVSLEVRNDSGYAINVVNASPTWDGDWGRDRLGNSTLPSGYHVPVNLSPDSYDLRLIDEDGDTCILHGFPVYSNRTLRVTHERLIGCELQTFLDN
jgi:hypothetical protein